MRAMTLASALFLASCSQPNAQETPSVFKPTCESASQVIAEAQAESARLAAAAITATPTFRQVLLSEFLGIETLIETVRVWRKHNDCDPV